MSICRTHVITGRTMAATKRSPLAVLSTSTEGEYNCVFLNTVVTQEIITRFPDRLLAVFDQPACLDQVNHVLGVSAK